ncbi:MAG: penicillin-binding protein 1A [Gammaproteobacteria bacterium]|nr:penicillin-binding protein 1A [Gammaproteobacteria bacterium]
MTGVFLIALGLSAIALFIVPDLPSIESLKDVQFQVPLRVYTRDQKLIAEFGEKKRAPLDYAEIPPLMVQAVLAAEDNRFFEHPGVDYQGLLRATFYLLRTGEKGQGGSTITMQVARNFFLSSEKTYLRKLNEILLALKIENELSKQDILALYLNKIYLGNRAYGVGAAAQVYYGRPVDQLSIAQLAMVAGLPKAPSRYNPIINPARALLRRNYVLGRMYELGFIDEAAHSQARDTLDDASLHGLSKEVVAPYVAEMVRAEMIERYGDMTYSAGYKVYTSIDSGMQMAANTAQRNALLAYDLRHGYRGALARHVLKEEAGEDQWMPLLQPFSEINGLLPALVLATAEQSAVVYEPHRGVLRIDWPGLSWAAPSEANGRVGAAPQQAADILSRGDVVYIRESDDATAGEDLWQLAQLPEVEGALVSMDPGDGGIRALVGGFNFQQSKFNRVTQAERQPGSNFKPFTYSAALEKGFTAASLINDAPVVFEDEGLEAAWRPENYSGKVFGPTRLRQALVESRNLVSIRLLRAIGIGYAINYVTRFGFDEKRLPRDLSLALGSGAVTPLELVSGFSVFANGGYRPVPYFIDRIEDAEGSVLYRAAPFTVCEACEEKLQAQADVIAEPGAEPFVGPPTAAEVMPVNIAPRVLTPQNAYLIRSMMRDVILYGTGRRARSLGRPDLAGKTGTTNDQHDAWFSGYTSNLVTTAWVGFDKPQPLGARETGGYAALPMWIEFMHTALKGLPVHVPEQPPGLVTVRIDPETGLLAKAGHPNAIFETFRQEHVPQRQAEESTVLNHPGGGDGGRETASDTGVADELF